MEKFVFVAIALAFPFLWAGISLVLANLSGWAELANRFPDHLTETGQTRNFCSGKFGIISYGSCLKLTPCPAGLRLAVMLPFRFGHPPLLIPWDQFQRVTEKRQFLIRCIETDVGRPLIATLELPIWLRDHLPQDESDSSSFSGQA